VIFGKVRVKIQEVTPARVNSGLTVYTEGAGDLYFAEWTLLEASAEHNPHIIAKELL